MAREFVCAATAVAFAALVAGDLFSMLTAFSMALIENFTSVADALGIAMAVAGIPSLFLAGWLARKTYRAEMLLGVSPVSPASPTA
tara:strand:- start:552 stop:809 length:258 start_codon:yes stop_codon:yes gene_type:complete